MPLYVFRCSEGHEVEKVLQIAERDNPGVCKVPINEAGEPCELALERVWKVRGRNAAAFTPIVLDRAPDGTYSFPMAAMDPILDGYQRIECTTFAELDKHIKQANVIERRKMDEHVAMQREQLNHMEKVNRAELREQMRHMQPSMRGFAELCMRKNDEKPRPTVRDANLYAEVRDMDASNRREYADKITGWRRKRV